ncbi:hypothetical protein [Bacillus cereus]
MGFAGGFALIVILFINHSWSGLLLLKKLAEKVNHNNELMKLDKTKTSIL